MLISLMNYIYIIAKFPKRSYHIIIVFHKVPVHLHMYI